MLGGKLFDSKDMGPYTTENLKKIQNGEITVQEAIDGSNSSKKDSSTIVWARPRVNDGKVGNISNTIRYPSEAPISNDTDYVSIDFFNYQPPFGKGEKGTYTPVSGDTGAGQLYENYHHSIGDGLAKNKAEGYKSILLFMPEDVQAQTGANWGGVGVGVGQANAASLIGTKSGMGKAWGGTWEAFRGGLKTTGFSMTKSAMNAIMGGSLTTNQLMGGVSGTIINPNVELMYEAPELRGFNLNFKMMPRSKKEANNINAICQTLKRAMLPSWGGQTKIGGKHERTGALMTIPKIVSCKFMTGNKLNPFITQFKPCAITNVNINYTADGTYATYDDGSPVATLLSVQFKELKLVFEQEIALPEGDYSPIASY